MPRRASSSVGVAEWPPALRQLLRAAEAECPPGHASALAELTVMAVRKIPARGIFDPAVRGEEDVFAAIESVARTHLELADAWAAWNAALDAAGLPLSQRDDISHAAQRVQGVSETAYFYAGLAFGLGAACVYR